VSRKRFRGRPLFGRAWLENTPRLPQRWNQSAMSIQTENKSVTESVWEAFWSNTGNHTWWKTPAPEVMDLIASLSPVDRPRILDLGCGLGRHAIAFAAAGFSVTATDPSPTAIQHLRDWANLLQLAIDTRLCDAMDETLPSDFFDVVLSYNVLYHGLRAQFIRAVRHVHRLLRAKGIFFFTCPSRMDGKYGFGEMVAPHTYRCAKSIAPGDIHYFADEADLDELLQDFDITMRRKSEGYWDHDGQQQFFSNWIIHAEKL
jgi:tellurite methyltransferase